MSKMPNISKGTKSTVYVLARYTNGRATLPYDNDVAAVLMREAHRRKLLDPDLERQWQGYEDANHRSVVMRQAWGALFIDAMDNGKPLPRRQRGKYLDHDADFTEMNSREAVLAALHAAGGRGMTAAEVRRYTGIQGGGIPGGLSEMHEAGLVARLDLKR